MANGNKGNSSKKKVREEIHEPVTKCDQSNEVVTNSSQSEAAKPNGDHIDKGEITLSQHDIEKLIVSIRGEQVLIDRDLAYIYQVEVKQMNRQVKRNIERFPEDFMFQLTKEEYNSLKCHFGTSNKRGGDRRALPYVFTQQGVGMLSGLLRSKIAIETNIKIMRAFVAMRRFMVQNAGILMRIAHLERHQLETDEKIDLILDKMEENSPKMLPEQIFATGCIWDAWAYVSDMVRSAKSRIILIDNFVDDRVLSMLDKRTDGVSATIYSRFYEQFQIDLRKHNEQYPAIEFVQLPHRNHDRFLIIDDKVYLMGASLKDMGAGLCAVTEMQIKPETILEMLKYSR
jgi:hypothetical protein